MQLLVLLASVCPGRAAGDTLQVGPGGGLPFSDIQTAIAAAVNGDVIELAAGTYSISAPIDLLGKQLTIRALAGPEITSVEQSTEGDVFFFGNGETDATVVEGVTIRSRSGNCVRTVSGSAPRLVGCVLTGSTDDVRGTGVRSDDSAPEFDRCQIVGQTQAIGCDSSMLRFDGCRLFGNRRTVDSSGSSLEFSNCVIADTWSTSFLIRDNSSLQLDHCTLFGNPTGAMPTFWVIESELFVTSSIVWEAFLS